MGEGGIFLFELKEVHPECGTHYDMWLEKGIFFVFCPTCDKAWEPCESAMRQYRQWCEGGIEMRSLLRVKQAVNTLLEFAQKRHQYGEYENMLRGMAQKIQDDIIVEFYASAEGLGYYKPDALIVA